MNDQEPKQSQRFITRLQTIERQVGEHILAALEDEETVAVLTTVASGLRADRIVSVPLSREQVADITHVLQQAQVDPDEDDAEPTIGFHVILDDGEEEDTPAPPAEDEEAEE